MRACNVPAVMVASTLSVAVCVSPASAGIVLAFADVSGLAGEAEFTIIDPTTLEVRLRNLSTGVPGGFSSADQLLTSVAFDLGGVTITGGNVATGGSSSTVNFSVASVGPGGDVSGEWGFGNGGTTGFGSHVNFISSNNAGATAFGGINLDGPAGLDGPQGGLVANPSLVALGGLGAIQHEIVATLTLSGTLSDLSFLNDNVIFEFGSDAFFHATPAPGALGLFGLALLARSRRRR
jgi:MYXO-CTERM domain-containing protein